MRRFTMFENNTWFVLHPKSWIFQKTQSLDFEVFEWKSYNNGDNIVEQC